MTNLSLLANRLALISQSVDNFEANRRRDPEAQTWGRIAKVMEELGEVAQAYIGVIGQNPRKGISHSWDDVEHELLDVALTALTAYEHVSGNCGQSIDALGQHVKFVMNRAVIDGGSPSDDSNVDFGGRVGISDHSSSLGDVSDGHHTFSELYEHRRALTAALAVSARQSWRSRRHHPNDADMYDGYFIVGIELPTGTVAYHYPIEHWDDFDFVPVVAFAPEWDGSGPEKAVERLLEFAKGRHFS